MLGITICNYQDISPQKKGKFFLFFFLPRKGRSPLFPYKQAPQRERKPISSVVFAACKSELHFSGILSNFVVFQPSISDEIVRIEFA